MSYIKFSPDLFLEKQELNRFKKFLDDDGFRAFLLANSLRFGLVDKQYYKGSLQNEFLNGEITEGAALTISNNAISAIDSSGNFISKDAQVNIATTPDSNWYWVKIKHKFSSVEKGVVAIDINGNLTGDANCRFLEVLRGQPNFPARIKFVGSTGNLLEYDVLDVIDDQNAILDNSSFTAESDLQYIVIGTFTPTSVPADTDKEIFQYDSCEFTLVQETIANNRPTFIEGTEFFLARIKNNGSTLVIQDKRTDFWQVKADFFANNIWQNSIVNFGIEKVKFNDQKSTRDKNVVYLSWTFRSTNYSINSNLNIVTIVGGQGGRYKTVNDFFDGDFDGYRLYTTDGTYSIVKSSIKTGGQINLYLDTLDIDKYSTDGGTTFTSDEIVLTPDAEEIQVICKAQEDVSQSSIHIDESQLSDQIFDFPINTSLAKFELLVYSETQCLFEISYRLKHTDVYGKEWTMQGDTSFGYYTEKAFDSTGNFLPIVNSNTYGANLAGGYIVTYSSNLLKLQLSSSAYSVQIAKLDIGDKLGVDTSLLTNATPQRTFIIGTDRQYQHFDGVGLTLSADMFLIISDLRADGSPVVNGNTFLLHFQHQIFLNTFKLRIVQDFVNPTSYTLIKDIDVPETDFINNSDKGLFVRVTFDGGKWIINSTNEVYITQLQYQIIPPMQADIASLLPILTAWTNYTVVNADMTCSPGTWTLGAGNGNIKYKKNGKTVTLDFEMNGTNFSTASTGQAVLAIPAGAGVPTRTFSGNGIFANVSFPTYNTPPDLGENSVRVEARADGKMYINYYNSALVNFYTNGTNCVIKGQVTFEIS